MIILFCGFMKSSVIAVYHIFNFYKIEERILDDYILKFQFNYDFINIWAR